MSTTTQPPDQTQPIKLLWHDKKLLRAIENPLYSGWEPARDITIIEQEPKFRWKGARIPFDMWAQVVAFMRWSQETFKEEAMLFFFYHVEDRKWAVWVFPQEPNGMTVKMLPDEPVYQEDRKRFGTGWIQFGTVHHHCTSGAFQSGTDKTDEEDRDGLHVTLGNMDKPTLDIHVRQVFDSVQSNTNILDWVEMPEYIRSAPSNMIWDFFLHSVKSTQGAEFPEEWKTRIYESTPFNHGIHGHFPNFPAGQAGGRKNKNRKGSAKAHNHHVPQQQQQQLSSKTLITSGTNGHSSKASTGTDGAGETARAFPHASVESYDQRRQRLLIEIIESMDLDAKEALRLLASVDGSTLNEEQKTLRNNLKIQLQNKQIPLLYAEDLLSTIIIKAAASAGK